MVKIKNIGNNKIVKALIGAILSAAGGFIFSGTGISGAASFADISLAGTLSVPYSAAVLIGAIVRCVMTDSVWRSIVKLAAMSIIVSAKLFSERCSRPNGCGIVTAAAVIISGSAVSALVGILPQKLLFYGLYGVISGFTAFSGAELIEGLREKRVIDLSGISGCVYGVVYVIYMAALFAMKLPWVSPGLILGAAFTLGAGYFYGGSGGVICGALTVSGAFLASADSGAAAAMLPVSGLIVGFLRRRRIFISAVFFALSFFMLSVLTGSSAGAELTFSIVCGGAAFVVLAPNFSDKWIRVNGENASESPDLSRIRFNFLSDAIEAVRLDSGRISAALSAGDPTFREGGTAKTVCRSCYRRSICRRTESETAGELIPILPDDCIRKREVAEELETELRSRAADTVMKLRFSEERELLNEHMKITGELVRSLGSFPELRCSDAMSRRIAEKLNKHDICPANVTASYNEANRLIVEVYFGLDEIAESSDRIRDLVSDELDMAMRIGSVVSSAREQRICLYEKPEYELEIYSASMSADGSEISGDSSVVFADGTGKSYVVLSDGMGSGRSAAVDSHIVIGMFKRLIGSGMELGAAVKLINSIMATKSRNESFATLDVIAFDPDDCSMISVKSGAAATILRRGDDVIKISAATFPVGITKQAELSSAEHQLGDGDMIVMFSDGISDSASLFIKELLLSGAEIREIVREMTVKAGVFGSSDHPDDVTVIGIKVRHS